MSRRNHHINTPHALRSVSQCAYMNPSTPAPLLRPTHNSLNLIRLAISCRFALQPPVIPYAHARRPGLVAVGTLIVSSTSHHQPSSSSSALVFKPSHRARADRAGLEAAEMVVVELAERGTCTVAPAPWATQTRVTHTRVTHTRVTQGVWTNL